jgi:hypothetical protein
MQSDKIKQVKYTNKIGIKTDDFMHVTNDAPKASDKTTCVQKNIS